MLPSNDELALVRVDAVDDVDVTNLSVTHALIIAILRAEPAIAATLDYEQQAPSRWHD